MPLFNLTAKLLEQVDLELYNFVTLDGSQPTPLFMTSWVLTLFSHSIETLEASRRVFDLILVEHPLIIVYLCVSVIVEC